ncbi:MAG: arsenate reductase ArsC [Nitrospirae bacterium]|nr:arsenate reductase ArsC [Nitrospirota bacterium]
MLRVMFLCTGNSCRSQIAEGLARYMGKGLLEVYSAGVMPVGVNPYAIAVMKEIGIDISKQTSDPIDPELIEKMDYVITLCEHADALCPRLPEGVKKIHWPIKDPVSVVGSPEVVMDAFRQTRDEIYRRLKEFFKDINQSS